ncbi:MAG TPA: DUF169 domain-containing protein [Bryobacteraceae bacterium]|nr:DUF169 domain-containing protein [Bryobacteraceae bacterium]
MPDYQAIEKKLVEALGGERRPVAITFTETPPQGVEKFAGAEPAACGFWRIAGGGRSFHASAADHLNCPIGAYTHNALPAERMPELEQALTLMSGLGYIRMEEVPGVFHMPNAAKTVVYTPLGETPVAPDAVLAAGRPGRVMLLAEAAARAGAMSGLPLLGRPTCMAIPAAIAGGAVTSSGCIGNRVYTGIGDDELYVVLRGSDLEKIAAELDTILSANRTLEQYHADRKQTLTVIA